MSGRGFVAVVDPNWAVEAGGGGRGANAHYALDSVDAIAQSYRASPPWRDVGPGLLWMWTTGAAILAGDAHALARSLGFRPCAEWVWVKTGAPGLGQWCRKRHEHLWLCRRGDVPVPAPADRPDSVVDAPRGRHSEKPEAAWHVIERVSSSSLPGAERCEWNARQVRPGWAAVGRVLGESAPIFYVNGERTMQVGL